MMWPVVFITKAAKCSGRGRADGTVDMGSPGVKCAAGCPGHAKGEELGREGAEGPDRPVRSLTRTASDATRIDVEACNEHLHGRPPLPRSRRHADISN